MRILVLLRGEAHNDPMHYRNHGRLIIQAMDVVGANYVRVVTETLWKPKGEWVIKNLNAHGKQSGTQGSDPNAISDFAGVLGFHNLVKDMRWVYNAETKGVKQTLGAEHATTQRLTFQLHFGKHTGGAMQARDPQFANVIDKAIQEIVQLGDNRNHVVFVNMGGDHLKQVCGIIQQKYQNVDYIKIHVAFLQIESEWPSLSDILKHPLIRWSDFINW